MVGYLFGETGEKKAAPGTPAFRRRAASAYVALSTVVWPGQWGSGRQPRTNRIGLPTPRPPRPARSRFFQGPRKASTVYHLRPCTKDSVADPVGVSCTQLCLNQQGGGSGSSARDFGWGRNTGWWETPSASGVPPPRITKCGVCPLPSS